MNSSVVNDKCIKFANALKSRGYKMRIGLEKDRYLKLSIFPADKKLSFVEDYVYIGYYPIEEDGFLMGWKVTVLSKMDKETFTSLSAKDLNAVVTARNDLLYFKDLLNDIGIYDEDVWHSERWWMRTNSFVSRLLMASSITGACVLRDIYLPNEEPIVKVG